MTKYAKIQFIKSGKIFEYKTNNLAKYLDWLENMKTKGEFIILKERLTEKNNLWISAKEKKYV